MSTGAPGGSAAVGGARDFVDVGLQECGNFFT